MKIKCVITDDEPIARKGIKGYVEKIDFLQLVGECEDALQLNTLLAEQEVDLIFLDIEMPYLTGMEFLAQLKNPPRIIITSAYEHYALQGYELNVTDYLLKPVSFERFLKAVNKVRDALARESAAEEVPYLFVKNNKQLKKINLNEILYVQSLENYVIIQSETSKVIAYSPLKKIMEYLPEPQFIQVHRSFVINSLKVEAIEGNQLVIQNYKIPIARNLREATFESLLKNKLISR
jgi:DNA-binding LytR/AlgR family response regulator